MEKINFRPVILGADVGAYSVARTFYEFYNVKTIVVCRLSYWMTSYSNITELKTINNLSDDQIADFLVDLSKDCKDTKLLLMGCSEEYVDIIIKHKKLLSKHYIIPIIDQDILNKVVIKENFYKLCEELNINYPNTLIVNKNNYKKVKVPFNYPIVAKASNKADYQRAEFVGQKKVFIFSNYEELSTMLNNCYSSTYEDDFIIQEYVAGEDSNMRVLTCFCDKNSDVIFSSVGKVLIEEKGDKATGNYSAIVNTQDDNIVNDAKKLLKYVKYIGYANFDIKYDDNTGKYYFFEVNVRLGRSNFYMASGHTNYLAPMVDSFILDIHNQEYHQKGMELYHIVPFYVINKYVKDKNLITEVKHLKKNNPLDYSKDFLLKRKIYVHLALINHIRKYKKNYGKW